MKPLRVICCDMKALLVTDERAVKVFKVLWKDVYLVTTELVTQITTIQSDNTKTVIKERKPRRSLFDVNVSNK